MLFLSQVFGHKQKYWKKVIFSLKMFLDEKVKKSLKFLQLILIGTHVWAKFHGNTVHFSQIKLHQLHENSVAT